MEEWKDIIGYEWLYAVSIKGMVKSLRKNIILKPGTVVKYKVVRLSKKNNKKMFSIHRLVAQAFLWLNIDDSKMLVCHRDDNPSNNYLNNLFLGTHQDNMDDMMNKRRKIKWYKGLQWILNHNSKKVIQLSLHWNIIKLWDSLSDISRELWICNWLISKCCNWKRKTAWWYKWEFPQ